MLLIAVIIYKDRRRLKENQIEISQKTVKIRHWILSSYGFPKIIQISNFKFQIIDHFNSCLLHLSTGYHVSNDP